MGPIVVALATVWVVVSIHPAPLFAYSSRRGPVVLHARAPLPPEASPILDDVIARISRSPLYDSAASYDVFLCNNNSLFDLFSLGKRSGGFTNPWQNVFIRAASVERNRVFDRRGSEKTGERTLAYYVAHEITHAMTMRRIGFFKSRRLATFQGEGYADYVALAHRFDFARAASDIQAHAFDMDPARSGLYQRYEVLVGYLLDERHWSADRLLSAPLDPSAVEREFLGDPALRAAP